MKEKNTFPKNILFVIVSISTLALIGVALWFLSANEYVERAELYVEAGNAFLKEKLEDKYLPIEGEAVEIIDDSYIKTEEGSFHVIFPNNSIMTLDQNTETQISYADGNMNILQESGSSWHRVKNILEGDSYNVETSNTLATVRGTILSIEEDEGGNTIVMVKEGTVEVSKIEKDENGNIVKVETKMIEEGTYALVSDGEEMAIGEITEEMKSTEWYAKNDEYDQMTLEEFIEAITNGGVEVKGTKDVQISFAFLTELLQKIFDGAIKLVPTATPIPTKVTSNNNYNNNYNPKPTATPVPPASVPEQTVTFELAGTPDDLKGVINFSWILEGVDAKYGFILLMGVEGDRELNMKDNYLDMYNDLSSDQRYLSFFSEGFEPGVANSYSICVLDANYSCVRYSNTINVLAPKVSN